MAASAAEAAGVVLAAGSGRRFGAAKQLADLDGRPLVVHAAETAVAAGLRPVVVVAGEVAAEVAAALGSRPVRLVVNEEWATGQASSLRCGLDALGDDVGVAVVLLADQPGVTPAAVRAVAAAVGAGTAPIARARYDDGPAHPVALARAVWGRLRALRGDSGARAVFDEVGVIDVPVPGSAPPDVDRPRDLARLQGGGGAGPPDGA